MTHVDPLWMKALLATHIASGIGSFLFAPIALATAKGGKQHKRWGMVYLWCMGGVAATALPMALYRPVLFLALVAVFSFYLAFSGYRVLRLKHLAQAGRPAAVDWVAAGVTFVCSFALAGLGVAKPALVQHMRIESVVFGLVGMRAAVIEIRRFLKRPTDRMFWWYTHLGNMIGSYIAAWSAFSVIVLGQYVRAVPVLVVWLWPTAVGVPAIVLTIIYYKRKFAPRKPVEAVA